MKTVLITGANRGLGLELVRQSASEGLRVHACCREPARAAALADVARGAGGRVAVHALDVSDHARVDALARELAGEPIDVLWSNAGVYGDRAGFGEVDYEVWRRTLEVNVLAGHKLSEAFVEHVARSERKVIAHVTSLMGSIGDNGSGGSYAYRSSKAALNAVGKSQALDLAPRGVLVVLLHPGWVKTDMGGQEAPIEPPESVRGMRAVVAGLRPEQSGRFFDYEGDELPW